MYKVKTIQFPTRPQVDTLIAFFIISKFGNEQFQNFSSADITINPLVPEGETFEILLDKEIFCLDVGKGPFDHHGSTEASLSLIVAKYFKQENNPALSKLLELASRSEQGKGTLSQDTLDKMFGFDGMIMTLNKTNQDNPKKVIDSMFPLVEAHYDETYKRSVIYPENLKSFLINSTAKDLLLNLGGKKIKTCIIETTDSGFISYLRAYSGGKYEIVVQILPTGHINVLTRMNNGINLQKLAYIVRSSESILKNISGLDAEKLMSPQRIPEIPEWYYDTVTNSLLNGGIHPATVKATQLSKIQMENLLKKWQEIY